MSRSPSKPMTTRRSLANLTASVCAARCSDSMWARFGKASRTTVNASPETMKALNSG